MGRISFFIVSIFLVAGLAGCGKKAQDRPLGLSENPQGPQIAGVSEREPEPRIPELTAEEKEREAVARRYADLDEIRTLIQVLKGERDSYAPMVTEVGWVAEMRTGTSLATSACRAFNRFQVGRGIVNLVERISPLVTSDEISETEGGIKILVTNAGLAAARELFVALQKPSSTTICNRGEGSFSTDEPLRVAENIKEVLVEIGKEPKDIGIKNAEIRPKVLSAVKVRLATIRKRIESGEASKSDVSGMFNYLVKDAVEHWHFTPLELGLTKDEAAQIR